MPPIEIRQAAGKWAREHKSASLVEAFIAGATAFYGKDSTKENVEVSDFAFEHFWNLYDYKKAKPQALKMWNRLSNQQRREVMDILPAYIASTPDKKYRMHPATFLNPANERWRDEITPPSNNGTTEQQSRIAGYAKAIADYR